MPIIENDFMELTEGLDTEAFWLENEQCQPFTPNKPRCSASFSPDDHWIFEFMQIPSTVQYYQNKKYRDELHKEVNRITEKFVGKTFFQENTWCHSPRRIENLFGSEFAYHEGGTPWLMPVTDDPEKFAKVLDRAEDTDLHNWCFPDAYLEEWETRKKEGKSLPHLGGGSRGPATVITSVLKPETALFWAFDHPDLMARFRDILAEKMVVFNQILRKFGSVPIGHVDQGISQRCLGGTRNDRSSSRVHT